MGAGEPEGRPARLARLRAVAQRALAGYDLPGPSARLICDGWNTTYRVDAADGQRFLLRLQRAPVTSVDRIAAELAWLDALGRDTDLVVPAVIRRRDGRAAAVEAAAGASRVCVLFRWTRGRFLEDGLRPVHLRRVGALLARLHDHAGTYTLPAGVTARRLYGVDEPSWYVADPIGPPTVDRLVALIDDVYGAGSGALVRAALERVRAVGAGLGEGPAEFGLVHGDLHQENYLFTAGGRVAAIDFDDCGFGHHAYDVAIPVAELSFRPDIGDLQAALLAGYRAVRPFSAAAEASIPTFVQLKRIQLMFWNIDRRAGATAHRWRRDVAADLVRIRHFLAA
jgi:Ser/Thr protein kinase RdoA (MazF antagonist)